MPMWATRKLLAGRTECAALLVLGVRGRGRGQKKGERKTRKEESKEQEA